MDVDEFGALFRTFLEDVVNRAPRAEAPLRTRVVAHLGLDTTGLPVVRAQWQPAEHANLQRAIDVYGAAPGRTVEAFGVAGQQRRYIDASLSDLLAEGQPFHFDIGPIEYTEVACGPGETLTCIQYGILLVEDGGDRFAVLVRGAGEMGRNPVLVVEALATDRDRAAAFIDELRSLMREHNVFRGRVVSLGAAYEGGPFAKVGVTFHELPTVTREQVVLPDGLLDRIERHTIGFARHRDRLAASGRHLRRGLLLYGPPGTGKTHTVGYLAGLMPERTILLLTGADQAMLSASFRLARELAPSMVVLEDIDLVAGERTMRHAPGALPLLFTLLNELDGLTPDLDVIAVLTTNRADIVEPALAARPGRVDLALELPTPDRERRRRLIDLYGRGLRVDSTGMDDVLDRTEGVSAAFIKELLRHAALISAERTADDPIVVTDADLGAALDDLLNEASALTATLLGAAGESSKSVGS